MSSEACHQANADTGESVVSVLEDQLRERQNRLSQNDTITRQQVCAWWGVLFLPFV
jgi:hypothetical protein